MLRVFADVSIPSTAKTHTLTHAVDTADRPERKGSAGTLERRTFGRCCRTVARHPPAGAAGTGADLRPADSRSALAVDHQPFAASCAVDRTAVDQVVVAPGPDLVERLLDAGVLLLVYAGSPLPSSSPSILSVSL